MSNLQCVLLGIFGGFLSYIIQFRNRKISNYAFPSQFDYRGFLFGLFVAILIGGVYTRIIIEATTYKQALLGGMTAEGFFIGLIRNSIKEG